MCYHYTIDIAIETLRKVAEYLTSSLQKTIVVKQNMNYSMRMNGINTPSQTKRLD